MSTLATISLKLSGASFTGTKNKIKLEMGPFAMMKKIFYQ